MRDRPQRLLDKLVAASRILVREGVLDVFGHLSIRDERNPDVFWLSTALPASRVEAKDMMAFDLAGEPLEPAMAPLFSERYIHAAILRVRPDVNAVCHHHSASLMPFCITGVPLRAVSQTGAFMGVRVRQWDSADSFGATRLLVDSPEQANSLAASLGPDSIILMRGHGATVAGRSLEDVTFKSVFSCRDADALRSALLLGSPVALSEQEIALAGQPAGPALERAWAHWTAPGETRREPLAERVIP
ncbi:MAG: class II aldolase/adducin family protein [Rhodobacteraceae bacterium]|nr:class II aldolase/adducin family protein [Paracoccaceae bacterium]